MLATSISLPHRHTGLSVQPGSNRRSNADIGTVLRHGLGSNALKPPVSSLGRLCCAPGFQLEVNGYRRAQNIEYRTVRVDDLLQLSQIGGRRTALQIDNSTNGVEASADPVFHGEEAAQIERSF